MIQMNFVFTCGSHCCHNSLCICSESEKYLKPQTFLVANVSNQRLFTCTRQRPQKLHLLSAAQVTEQSTSAFLCPVSPFITVGAT